MNWDALKSVSLDLWQDVLAENIHHVFKQMMDKDLPLCHLNSLGVFTRVTSDEAFLCSLKFTLFNLTNTYSLTKERIVEVWKLNFAQNSLKLCDPNREAHRRLWSEWNSKQNSPCSLGDIVKINFPQSTTMVSHTEQPWITIQKSLARTDIFPVTISNGMMVIPTGAFTFLEENHFGAVVNKKNSLGLYVFFQKAIETIENVRYDTVNATTIVMVTENSKEDAAVAVTESDQKNDTAAIDSK